MLVTNCKKAFLKKKDKKSELGGNFCIVVVLQVCVVVAGRRRGARRRGWRGGAAAGRPPSRAPPCPHQTTSSRHSPAAAPASNRLHPHMFYTSMCAPQNKVCTFEWTWKGFSIKQLGDRNQLYNEMTKDSISCFILFCYWLYRCSVHNLTFKLFYILIISI